MFIFISILIAMSTILTLSYLSKQKRTSLKQNFDSLVVLREILLLCRQHRMHTHHVLSCTHQICTNKAIDGIYDKLTLKSSQLIRNVDHQNKPMYRVFQRNLKSMHDNWQRYSTSRNQIVHGKNIRHCLFLMDEIAITWLSDSGCDDISNTYHTHWQLIFDSMEALTQLRVVIQDYHRPNGHVRIRHYCQKMSAKLNQLSMINSLILGSPKGEGSMQQLEALGRHQNKRMTEEELYQLTSDVSLLIALAYDHVLSKVAKQLYQPLPHTVTN
ncbi:hypothetical protein AB4259_12775 [Vibrio amylolyticus]|uniref:hypothetical protein n=1 Tax=Vibrio amylolyticus TaxID=2847292 RepID=UPI003552D7FE